MEKQKNKNTLSYTADIMWHLDIRFTSQESEIVCIPWAYSKNSNDNVYLSSIY